MEGILRFRKLVLKTIILSFGKEMSFFFKKVDYILFDLFLFYLSKYELADSFLIVCFSK